MTNKTTMPDPVAWIRRHPDGALTAEFLEEAVISTGRKQSGAWLPMITTTQAEAYADACVREALMEAYRSIQELHMSLMNDSTPYVHPAQIASFAANRISTLIPKYTHSMLP